MKTVPLLLISLFVVSFLSTCQQNKEKAIIEGLLDEKCSMCEWKVLSITDTVGYSIAPVILAMEYSAIRGNWEQFDKDLQICHDQSFNWTKNRGGVERRLLIAHCADYSGKKTDFEFFNEIKDGRSVRYYLAADEVTDYLDITHRHL